MLTITCPDSGLDHTFGPDTALSSHATSQGTVTYHRCPCGRLVTAWPGGSSHVCAAVLCDHVDTAEKAVDGPRNRTVGDYLQFLTVLDGAGTWAPVVRWLVHDIVLALYRATGDSVTAVPHVDDPRVAHVRAIGRLAERTAASTVPVDPETARTVDALCRYLRAALT